MTFGRSWSPRTWSSIQRDFPLTVQEKEGSGAGTTEAGLHNHAFFMGVFHGQGEKRGRERDGDRSREGRDRGVRASVFYRPQRRRKTSFLYLKTLRETARREEGKMVPRVSTSKGGSTRGKNQDSGQMPQRPLLLGISQEKEGLRERGLTRSTTSDVGKRTREGGSRSKGRE